MADQFPPQMSLLQTPLLEKKENNDVLIHTKSLLKCVCNSNETQTSLNTILQFRRENAKQRRELNANENNFDQNRYWIYSTTMIKNIIKKKWSRHIIKSLTVSLISIVQIVCWIMIAVVQQSIPILISAAVGCLASFVTLLFEPKVHHSVKKVSLVIAPEEDHLRNELCKVKNENKVAKERVQELRQVVYRQNCVLEDIREMKFDIKNRRNLLEKENEEILKKIRKCETKALFIEELFNFLFQKSVHNDCEEKEQKSDESEESIRSKLKSILHGKSEFQVEEIKKIIYDERNRHSFKIGIDPNPKSNRLEMKHQVFKDFSGPVTSRNSGSVPSSITFYRSET